MIIVVVVVIEVVSRRRRRRRRRRSRWRRSSRSSSSSSSGGRRRRKGRRRRRRQRKEGIRGCLSLLYRSDIGIRSASRRARREGTSSTSQFYIPTGNATTLYSNHLEGLRL